MRRLVGRAELVLPSLQARSFDLVLTSPPAYPSPRQDPGSIGTEGVLQAYVDNLGKIMFQCRRLLKLGGFLALIIEPLPGHDVMAPLSLKIRRQLWRMLATYRWSYGDGGASWVVLLGKGPGARLNQMASAWATVNWGLVRPPPDAEYGFYEWPSSLVEAICELTIPNGGLILDPFAGKATALSQLDLPFEVVAVDVMDFDDEDSSSNKSGLDALADPVHRGGLRSTKEIS